MQAYDRERGVNLFGMMLRAGLWIASAALTGYLAQTYSPLRVGSAECYGFASMFLFAWATLARLSEGKHSWDRETMFERIDVWLLWALFWLGMYTGTVAAL